jgi:hypothetical protein
MPPSSSCAEESSGSSRIAHQTARMSAIIGIFNATANVRKPSDTRLGLLGGDPRRPLGWVVVATGTFGVEVSEALALAQATARLVSVEDEMTSERDHVGMIKRR